MQVPISKARGFARSLQVQIESMKQVATPRCHPLQARGFSQSCGPCQRTLQQWLQAGRHLDSFPRDWETVFSCHNPFFLKYSLDPCYMPGARDTAANKIDSPSGTMGTMLSCSLCLSVLKC